MRHSTHQRLTEVAEYVMDRAAEGALPIWWDQPNERLLAIAKQITYQDIEDLPNDHPICKLFLMYLKDEDRVREAAAKHDEQQARKHRTPHKLCGIKPRATKMPLLARSEDRKVYKFPVSVVNLIHPGRVEYKYGGWFVKSK